MFGCDICTFESVERNTLIKHLWSLHLREFKCDNCKKECVTKERLMEHSCKNFLWKTLICNICGYRTTRRDVLRTHCNHVHLKDPRIKYLFCESCPKQFRERKRLSEHLFYCLGLESFRKESCVCDLCNVKLSDIRKMQGHFSNIHLNRHLNRKSICCDGCRKEYLSKVAATAHLVRCTKFINVESAFCNSCNFSTSSTQLLIYHIKGVHEKLKSKKEPYKCERCRKKFAWKSSLMLHGCVKVAHFYICDVCDMKTQSKKYLLTHVKTVHYAQKETFVCECCGKQFNNKQYFFLHDLRIHQKRAVFHICNECPYSTNIKRNFFLHWNRIHGKKKK